MSANGHHQKTMRAVVWEGKPYEVVVRDVPRPKIEMPEDAIVRITSASICASDIHNYHGIFGSTTPPWTMGHEGVGVVVETGKATEQFKVGDRVIIPCGHDPGSFVVERSTVPNFPFYGAGDDFGGLGGCQAEYVRVPYADDSLIAIPDDFSSDINWIFLTDVFITGWTGLDYAKFQPGEEVAVFGLGPVGLMAVYAATLRGASRIYAVDHVRARLDKAAALGAIPIDFTSSEGSASEQILRRQPQGVQRVVDCIGQNGLNAKLRPQQNYVINEAIKVASFTGGIGIVALYGALPTSEGVPRGDTMDSELLIRYPDVWMKGLTIGNGAIVGMYEVLPRLFELVRTGKARLDFIVSAQVGIEDAPKMYERFDKKLETKVIIRFPWTREVAPLAASESVEDEQPKEVEELKQNGHTAQNGHGLVRQSHLPLRSRGRVIKPLGK